MTTINKSGFLPGDVYTNKPLTQAAIKLFQRPKKFVARNAVPRMPVNKLSGTYYKWKRADLNRNEMKVRGPNSPTPLAAFGKELATFAVQARSLGYNLNDWVKLGADVEINPAQVIPMVLSYKAALNLELLFSAFAFASGNWYRTVTGAAANVAAPNRRGTTGTRAYLDDEDEDPIKGLREEIRDIGKLTGFEGDAVVFGVDAFEAVATHPLVRATLTSGSIPVLRDAPASEVEIAKLLGVEYVGVGSAIYNTALENETESNNYIIPSGGLLVYRRGTSFSDEPVASVAGDAGVFNPEFPTAMVRAQWEAAVGNQEGFRLRSFRDEDAGPGGSEKTVCDSAHDFTGVDSKMGILFQSMLTP